MPRFDPCPGEFPIEQWDSEFRQRVCCDESTYGNVEEEPVRQWAAARLVQNLGVPRRQIKFEDPVRDLTGKANPQAGVSLRNAVVVDGDCQCLTSTHQHHQPLGSRHGRIQYLT